jgi:hypothetical protein
MVAQGLDEGEAALSSEQVDAVSGSGKTHRLSCAFHFQTNDFIPHRAMRVCVRMRTPAC